MNAEQTILSSFDKFLSQVNGLSSQASGLQVVNAQLKEEVASLQKELKRRDAARSAEELDVAGAMRERTQALRQYTSQLETITKEIAASAKLEQSKFEIASLLNQVRGHTREVQTHQAEHERLLRGTQQLQRELAAAKNRINELEKVRPPYASKPY